MKTIIMIGYLSGIIYKLLCTNIIKIFANGSIEAFDQCMETIFIPESGVKIIKLVSDLIMFVFMIFAAMLWPIILLYKLFIKIKNKYWEIRFIRKLKKLRKTLEMIIGKD